MIQSPHHPGECVSDLRLDQLLNGELSAEEAAGTRAHAAACARCGGRLDRLDGERAAFSLPPPWAAARARRSRWISIAAAAACAAGIWIAVRGSRPAGPTEETRRKGAARIGFYVKHDGVIRKGGRGEVVFPDDALEFTYSTDSAGYLAILSIDAAGAVSVYYPAGAAAERVEPAQDRVLPLSVILDGTLGRERLFGLVCRRPVELAALVAALRASPDAAPAGCSVDDDLFVVKRGAP